MEVFNLYNETGSDHMYRQVIWMLPSIIIFGVLGYFLSVKLNVNKQKRFMYMLAPVVTLAVIVGALAIDEIIFNFKWNMEKLVLQDAKVLQGVVTAKREKKGRKLYEVIEIGGSTLWRIAPIYDKYLPDSCYQDLVRYADFNNKEVEIRYVPLHLNESDPSEVSYCITYVAVL